MENIRGETQAVYIICPEEVQETSGGWDMAVSGN
jgi:hypothetical protein